MIDLKMIDRVKGMIKEIANVTLFEKMKLLQALADGEVEKQQATIHK